MEKWESPPVRSLLEVCLSSETLPRRLEAEQSHTRNIHTGIILLKRRTVCYYGEFCKSGRDNAGKGNGIFYTIFNFRCAAVVFIYFIFFFLSPDSLNLPVTCLFCLQNTTVKTFRPSKYIYSVTHNQDSTCVKVRGVDQRNIVSISSCVPFLV